MTDTISDVKTVMSMPSKVVPTPQARDDKHARGQMRWRLEESRAENALGGLPSVTLLAALYYPHSIA